MGVKCYWGKMFYTLLIEKTENVTGIERRFERNSKICNLKNNWRDDQCSTARCVVVLAGVVGLVVHHGNKATQSTVQSTAKATGGQFKAFSVAVIIRLTCFDTDWRKRRLQWRIISILGIIHFSSVQTAPTVMNSSFYLAAWALLQRVSHLRTESFLIAVSGARVHLHCVCAEETCYVNVTLHNVFFASCWDWALFPGWTCVVVSEMTFVTRQDTTRLDYRKYD